MNVASFKTGSPTAPAPPRPKSSTARPVRRKARKKAAPLWPRKWQPKWRLPRIRLDQHGAPLIALLLVLLALGEGIFTFVSMSGEPYTVYAFVALILGLIILAVYAYRRWRTFEPLPIALLGATIVAASVVGGLPEYVGVLTPNGILHRTVVTGLVLLLLCLPALSAVLFQLFGRTPRAQDMSRYPYILAPVLVMLGVYGALIVDLVIRSNQQLQGPSSVGLHVFFQPFIDPTLPPNLPRQSGLLNQLLGTLLLIALTTAISLPIGVCTGVFLSEFGVDWEKRVVSLASASLRGISALLIAQAGISIVRAPIGDQWLKYLDGFYYDETTLRLGKGSFLLAGLILSLLVIPVIARATQIGCASVPHDMRTGSAALGARPDYTLRRIVLPWALPSIVTSVLLGCAEAAGSVSVILLIGGAGSRGIGLFTETTSLAYSIFAAQFSPLKVVRDAYSPYQFAAALELLVLALAFTIVALVVKRQYAARYQGV